MAFFRQIFKFNLVRSFHGISTLKAVRNQRRNLVQSFHRNSISSLSKWVNPSHNRNFCSDEIKKTGTKKAAIILANNFDEIEAACVISLLRRCGIEVTTVGLYSADVILGSSKMHLKPEMSLTEAFPPKFDMDAIILTGGNSAVEFMRKEETLCRILKKQEEDCKIVAAIGLAPLVLKQFQVFCQKQLTSYPTAKAELEQMYDYQEEDIINDCMLITSRGPGTAHLFALTLCYELAGCEKTKAAAEMCLYQYFSAAAPSFPKVLIVVANGFEEIEYAITMNLMDKSGADVTTAALYTDKPVTGLNKMLIVPHASLCLAIADNYDAIILIGGCCCVEAMKGSEQLNQVLARQEQCCRIVAAIGQAPLVVKEFKLFQNKCLTSHPSAKSELIGAGYQYQDTEDVVNHGKLITSKGPGTAHLFALTLCVELVGAAKAKQIAQMCLYPYSTESTALVVTQGASN